MTKFFIAALTLLITCFFSCNPKDNSVNIDQSKINGAIYSPPDTNDIPHDKFGDMVRYGKELMLHTSHYIGPEGVAGKYLGNKMNCTNCHQDAGTKAASFNLMLSHSKYPQYRAREGKVLSLAERVNNCVERPHSGKPLPLDSKEMIAILSYLKWINSKVKDDKLKEFENLAIKFPERAADPARGQLLFNNRCLRCHGAEGEGRTNPANATDYYMYPPLWGDLAYQPGSSMHRIIKQARWLKANMPHDSATWQKPVLTDEEALDIAAFVNDDRIHQRPSPKTLDYPHPEEKAIDYGHGPFADPFTEEQHKFGPYGPIIDYWKKKGLNPSY